MLNMVNMVMTTSEAAAEYGIADATVRQSLLRGDIPARKSGGTWIVLRADAEARWGDRAVAESDNVELAREIAQQVTDNMPADHGWREGEDGEIINPHGERLDREAAVELMDDNLREALNDARAWADDAQYFAAYAAAHKLRFNSEWELAKPNPVW